MKNIKNKKVIALVIAGVIACSTLIVAFGEIVQGKSKSNVELSKDDKVTATEVSNMTGVPIDEVIKLKAQNRSWTQVLELLKDRKNLKNDKEKDNRSNLLAEAELEKDFVEKLKKEGFNNSQITETKMLVDRVIFQLSEITSQDESSIKESTVNGLDDVSGKEKSLEDISAYADLAKKVQLKDSIYFMLKLKKEFTSYEKVFDEYLFSLQADLKLDICIQDKKAYDKEKKEKSAAIDLSKIITLDKIEQKVLEKLQKRTEKTEGNKVDEKNPTQNTLEGSKDKKDDIKPPLPDVNINQPIKPGTDTMKEIKDINNNTLKP